MYEILVNFANLNFCKILIFFFNYPFYTYEVLQEKCFFRQDSGVGGRPYKSKKKIRHGGWKHYFYRVHHQDFGVQGVILGSFAELAIFPIFRKLVLLHRSAFQRNIS